MLFIQFFKLSIGYLCLTFFKFAMRCVTNYHQRLGQHVGNISTACFPVPINLLFTLFFINLGAPPVLNI